MAVTKSTAASERHRLITSAPNERPTIGAELLDVRQRLALIMATCWVTSAALRAQNADNDLDAALVLQRSVGDELDRQIGRLDAIAARCGKAGAS